MKDKKYIGIIYGGSTLVVGRRIFGTVDRVTDKPVSRREAVDAIWDSLCDAIVNCDEDYVEVVAYRADSCNPVHFRISDRNEQEDALRTVKEGLIDGELDVVNIKPKYCIETGYMVVPVE